MRAEPSDSPFVPDTAADSHTPHLLFDLDGTLTNPFDGIARCLTHALQSLGHPVRSISGLGEYIGPPLRSSLAALLNTSDANLIERAVVLYRERYFARGLYENECYAGIEEALALLRDAGHRMFVVTSKLDAPARRIIEHFKLDGFFDGIYGSDAAGTLDDKAELLAHALSTEGLDPARCIMIGDRLHDVMAARRNGVRCVGVTWGFGGTDELRAAGADALCDDVRLLPALLADIAGRGYQSVDNSAC